MQSQLVSSYDTKRPYRVWICYWVVCSVLLLPDLQASKWKFVIATHVALVPDLKMMFRHAQVMYSQDRNQALGLGMGTRLKASGLSSHFFIKVDLFWFYVYGCLLSMYFCTTCVQCPWRLEEGIGSSGTGVADSCKPLCEMSLSPLQE